MNIKKTRGWLLVLAALGMLFVAVPAMATSVSLELLLLVDTSGSVSNTEYNLQKTGYVNAFNSAAVQSAIASFAGSGGIAVAYAEWSGTSAQSLQVGWTQLTDAASASAFATAINGVSRAYNANTAPGSAINWGVPLFTGNGFEGNRLVIDVSGDGAQNEGANTLAAAIAAYNAGITLNGLAILGESGLAAWYQANIVTPGNGTLYSAADFDAFGAAVQDKIGREITGVPEPGTLLLLGGGLLGLVGYGRRMLKK